MANYDSEFFQRYRTGSERSARATAECLLKLLAPKSVLDVGCGTGVWLDAFRGAADVHGVDGPWSPASARLQPSEFTRVNFEKINAPSEISLPQGKYDLVMSLEFLEHVSAEKADILVDFLCATGDTLLISAAIPLQGGEHHVNERWPEYWVEKFSARGFVPFDGLRLALWNDPRIDSWYRQNFMLYFRGAVPEPIMHWGKDLAVAALLTPHARVHPAFYAKRLGRLEYALRNPLGFVRMLLQERRNKQRGIPPIPHLPYP